jgi:hypothetical protein
MREREGERERKKKERKRRTKIKKGSKYEKYFVFLLFSI